MDTTALFAFGGATLSATLTLVFILRNRRSIPHWAFVAGMALLALESAFGGLSAMAESPADVIYWQKRRLLVMSFLPGIWLLFSLTYARGNARQFLNRWRFLLASAFVLPLGVATLFRANLVESLGRTAPGDAWMLRLAPPGLVLYLFGLIGCILVMTNLERTFRASVGTMRWRIKFALLGLVVLFAARAYTNSQALLFHGLNLSLGAINSGALILACLLVFRSLFRAGNFDLALYPSQAVIHNSLTILLAGIYLFLVGVFAKVVSFFGGDSAFPLKALVVLIALVLLAVVLQSDRVRLETRRFISRHFRRPMYDYRTIWRRFTAETSSHVDHDSLSRALVTLVADIFQTLSVTLWLVDEKERTLTFAASTSLPKINGHAPEKLQIPAADIMHHFLAFPEPIDIEENQEDWAKQLKQNNPGEFPNGGNRICLPLSSGEALVGLMLIGDRVGGGKFSIQEFDTLKCVGGHAAASLLNAQLSQRLLQARELEAFQKMAAFFVHDLKNAAATLTLMLQNLPVHWNDPEFRTDALRAISKTGEQINQTIRRLSLLRHELSIHPSETNLNAIVSKSIAHWESRPGVSLEKQLNPLPVLNLDAEQIGKVLTNLVMNAAEAVEPGGQIKVSTSIDDQWAVVEVADDGCGMSKDFLDNSLFRPFKTTKRNGLGIGMFQSKMIVEAHGGRISVSSEPGRGTAFRVFLPTVLSSS